MISSCFRLCGTSRGSRDGVPCTLWAVTVFWNEILRPEYSWRNNPTSFSLNEPSVTTSTAQKRKTLPPSTQSQTTPFKSHADHTLVGLTKRWETELDKSPDSGLSAVFGNTSRPLKHWSLRMKTICWSRLALTLISPSNLSLCRWPTQLPPFSTSQSTNHCLKPTMKNIMRCPSLRRESQRRRRVKVTKKADCPRLTRFSLLRKRSMSLLTSKIAYVSRLTTFEKSSFQSIKLMQRCSALSLLRSTKMLTIVTTVSLHHRRNSRKGYVYWRIW